MTAALTRLATALSDRYLIDREIGAGGMATVYLAHDIKHDRKVAIKVLRSELAAVIGAERFLSEIKTTANLQHPHILPLFDSGVVRLSHPERSDSGGREVEGPQSVLYYVMPFVEGISLRDRMTREKQLPITDAVRIASEIAAALDYAHRHGVIHRDIKPENILLHDGSALVADFGIALAASKAGTRMTETGMSLGTPQYMSPEQAMGERELDARSDVYALGCVTYEMLTGEPPFSGPTAQAIVAKVMTAEPAEVTVLRKTVPAHVADAVHTALQKLPADRFASAAEFSAALGGSRPAPTRGTRAVPILARHTGRVVMLASAIAVVATVAAVWGWLRPRPPAAVQPPTRLAILVPALGGSSTALQRQLALTPDGTTLLYTTIVNGENRTMRHDLDADEPVQVSGVPSFLAGYVTSPDGEEFIGAVNSAQEMYRFPIRGGNGRALPRELRATQDAAWAPDGSIWFDGSIDVDLGIARLGPDNVLTRPFGTRNINLIPMQVLADNRTALVISRPFGAAAGPVHLLDLESGESTPLLDLAVVQIRYTAGHLVYALASGTLEVVAFDPGTRKISGRAVTIAAGVSLSGTGVAQFAVSASGTVAYIPEAERSLVLIDRAGGIRSAVPDRHNFHSPRFSPDGRRIAVDYTAVDGRDVWLADLASGTLTRTTFNRDGHDASWSADGSFLTFISAMAGVLGIHRVRPGSTEPAESLFASTQIGYTGIWLRDGSAIVTAASALAPGSGSDIGIIRNSGRGPIEPLVATRFDEAFPAVSPDNRWLAYVSNQSGKSEVYLRALDGGEAQVQVSVDGGVEPVWGPNSRELFYRGGAAALPELIVASIQGEPEPTVGSRRSLFGVVDMATATPHSNYDISPDARTFVMVRNNPSTRIMVIQNLPALVAKLRGE